MHSAVASSPTATRRWSSRTPTPCPTRRAAISSRPCCRPLARSPPHVSASGPDACANACTPSRWRRRRARQFDRRSVAVDPARDGMAWLTAYLPAETAVAIDDRLDQLAGAMRDPADPRTFAQLRADAFCDLMVSGEIPSGEIRIDRQGSRSSSGHPGARSRHRAGPDPAATRRRARVARGLRADSRRCRPSARRARHRASRGCSRIPRPGLSFRWDATATRCRPICGSGCGCATRPAVRRGAGGERPRATSTTAAHGLAAARRRATISPISAVATIFASTGSGGGWSICREAFSAGHLRWDAPTSPNPPRSCAPDC